MISVNLSPRLVNNARSLYDFRAKQSFTQMKSSIYGAVGELVVQDYYEIPLCNTKDYDIMILGNPFDIKAKRCTSEPKPHFWVSVAQTSLHQKCSYYLFVRVHENLKKAWLLGFTSKEALLRIGYYREKGEKDPYGFKIVSNCYSLKISQLWNA